MSWRWAATHLFISVVVIGWAMVGVLVVAHEAQANDPANVRTVCVASWDCDANKRIAPRPDASVLGR